MSNLIPFGGDSFTRNFSNGVRPSQFYPAVAQRKLEAATGKTLRCPNFGMSGSTSAQQLATARAFFRSETPVAASLYTGANDAANASTVAASPTPTTTAFGVASALAASTMATPGSSLIVGGESRRVKSVSGAVITLTEALSGAPAAGAAVTIDTTANIVRWGLLMKAHDCPRLAVCIRHFDNCGSGDTVETEAPAASALRVKQRAAITILEGVAGLEVLTVDFHAAMKARIQAGTDTAGYAITTVAAGASPGVMSVADSSRISDGRTVVVDGYLGTVVGAPDGGLVTVRGIPFAPPTNAKFEVCWNVADVNFHTNPYGHLIKGEYWAQRFQTTDWISQVG